MTSTMGIDLSLTNTGIAIYNSEAPPTLPKWMTTNIKTKVTRGKHKTIDTLERMDDVLAQIEGYTGRFNPDVVCIEGMAFGQNFPGARVNAALWWMVMDHLTWRSADVIVVPPTVRAKYATGRGRCSKEDVILAVKERYPRAEVTDHNVADAIILCAIGMRAAGHPLDEKHMTVGTLEAFLGVDHVEA